MSRIAATFHALRERGRKGLVPYLMAGDPYADATVEIMLALAFGLFGYWLNKHDYEVAPLLLGFILGPLMEENLRTILKEFQSILQSFRTAQANEIKKRREEKENALSEIIDLESDIKQLATSPLQNVQNFV